MKIIVAFIFFATGFNSLTYQVIWNKVLSQTVGVDFLSNVMIVSIFMLGLGLGGIFGSAVLSKTKNSIKYFLIAEVIIALFGAFSIDAMYLLQDLSSYISGGDHLAKGLAVDFILNFSLLIIPTIMMGASLPIVVDYYGTEYRAGSALAILYAINIFGAAAGAAISGIYLIGIFGLHNTGYLSSSIIIILIIPCLLILNHKKIQIILIKHHY